MEKAMSSPNNTRNAASGAMEIEPETNDLFTRKKLFNAIAQKAQCPPL
jgi:hypothetical protein